MLRIFLYWLAMAAAAVANGAIGEFAIRPWAGDTVNQVYKTVVLVTVIFLLARQYMKRVEPHRARPAAWRAGISWIILTIIFEFGFGHYVVGDSWETLLAAYRVWEGQFWIIVPLAELLAPVFWARQMHKPI